MEQNQISESEQTSTKKSTFGVRQMRKCKVCSHEKNVEVTEKYLNEEISLRTAGQLLNCHYLSFQRHINQHVLPVLERDPMIAPDLRLKVDKMRILEDMINKLYVRAQLSLEQEDTNAGEIKAITSELNNFLQTLARLTKEIGNDVNINVNADSELFRRAAEDILLVENPEIWKKIRAKMIELASHNRIA